MANRKGSKRKGVRRVYYLEYATMSKTTGKVTVHRRRFVVHSGYKPFFYKVRDHYIHVVAPLRKGEFKDLKLSPRQYVVSARILDAQGRTVHTSKKFIGYNPKYFK